MDASDAAIQQAEQRMRERMESSPRAIAARYDRRVSRIVVGLSNGLELAFPPRLAEGLADAKPGDLAAMRTSICRLCSKAYSARRGGWRACSARAAVSRARPRRPPPRAPTAARAGGPASAPPRRLVAYRDYGLR